MARRPLAPIPALVLLLAGAILSGCQTDGIAGDHTPQVAAAAQPAPQAAPAPEEPITEHQASAACWMKFERGRKDLPLEARAKLVDKCIDERMKAAARQ
jgi:hypothetical protein